MMKRSLILLLALAFLMIGTPTLESSSAASDSPVVQDMYDYMQNSMTFEKIETGKNNEQHRKFSGGADAYELIDGYVRDLCNSGTFTLVDSYYKAFSSGEVFFSYALDYAGSSRLPGNKSAMNFVDDVYGDLTIYGTVERSKCKGYIFIVNGLEFGDLGLRIGGQTVDVSLPGSSLGTDLYLLQDGSYQTGDGRFHVSVGQAQVYRDGELYTTDASLVRNQAKGREEVRIYNFYRNDSIILSLPYNSVLTGDTLDKHTIGVNKESGYEEFMDDMEDFLAWKFSDQLLGVSHDGELLLCYRDDYNDFDDVAVNVMYWDTAQDVAVFYVCATFDTAPYTYEAVAAVSMGGTPQGTNADAVFNMSAGKELQITFDAAEYSPSYELFTWEILEGSSLIELSNTRSKTCTVRAYDPGTVRLKILYEYGAEGTNVLTGRSETQFMSKTREYVINIAP